VAFRRALAVLLGLACAGASSSAWAQATFDETAAIGRSVASMGSFERVAKAFARARRGQSVTIAAIGGSVTEGAWASRPEGRYLDLVAAWWRAQFPGSTLRVVNAGIGGTASNYGALRVGSDLLAAAPDVVIVEYSVNDEWNDASVESYEGLVRQILRAPKAPAVLLLALVAAGGASAQPQHARVAAYYNLPMISFGDALRPLLQSGSPVAQTLFQDAIHPNDAGHAFIARLVTHWLDLALHSADGQEGRPLTADVFDRATLPDAKALSPASAAGWTYRPDLRAWEAMKPGATMICDVSGTALFLSFYVDHGPRGELGVSIDGRPPVVVDSWVPPTNGSQLRIRELARGLPPGPHRIALRVLDASNPDSGGHTVRIFGIGASSP
jgi:lysophospholipase L1-like esterase